MTTILITYNGYALIEWGRGYKSEIDGRWIQFDTAGQWKQFIDKRHETREERDHRR